MIHLATTCGKEHLEFVPALSRRDGAPYFGASATHCCRHVIGGEPCKARIEDTQVLWEEHGALGTGVCPCCLALPDSIFPVGPGADLRMPPLPTDPALCETCETLRRHDRNITHTARAIGLQRTYLSRLIKTLGVER
jgi:hypothetical protein